MTDAIIGKLNVDEIQISIDGLESGHDSLRGKGTFKKALAAVCRAKKAGFGVSVATMVHPGNTGDFDEMERMFRHIGVREWSVDVPCPAGNLMDNPSYHMPPETSGRFLRYGFGGGSHGSAAGFGCGAHLMAVLPDGRCAKCTFYYSSDYRTSGRTLGHFTEGLRVCWGRLKPVRLHDLECAGNGTPCDVIDICRGGCRYRAEITSSHGGGGGGGKDLYRCALYNKLGCAD